MVWPHIRSPGWRQREAQLRLVTDLAQQHLDIDVSSEDYAHSTNRERGHGVWVHQPMVAALDLINAYERRRKSVACGGLVNMHRKFEGDARTRACEVLKRYLVTRMQVERLEEAELRGYSEFCHALVLSADHFPSRNKNGFVQTVAEVYSLLDQLHLRVLRDSTTCAQLTERVLILGRNLLSDVLGYLVLTVTDFPATLLRSLEPVVLFGQMGPGGHLSKARRTDLGELVYGLLVRAAPLFGLLVEETQTNAAQTNAAQTNVLALMNSSGVARESPDAVLPPVPVDKQILRTKEHIQTRQWHHIGLPKLLEKPEYTPLILQTLECFSLSYQLTFFLTRCVNEFQRIGQLFGDYGAISSARVLHPLLGQLSELAGSLGAQINDLDQKLDVTFVLEPAQAGPAPRFGSDRPRLGLAGRRLARERIQRAVKRPDSHVSAIQAALDSLRRESEPDRMPRLKCEVQEALGRLRGVFRSAEFLRYANAELLAVTDDLEHPMIRGNGEQPVGMVQDEARPDLRDRMQLHVVFAQPIRAEEAFMVASRISMALQHADPAKLVGLCAQRSELRDQLGPVVPHVRSRCCCCDEEPPIAAMQAEVRREVFCSRQMAADVATMAQYVLDARLTVTPLVTIPEEDGRPVSPVSVTPRSSPSVSARSAEERASRSRSSSESGRSVASAVSAPPASRLRRWSFASDRSDEGTGLSRWARVRRASTPDPASAGELARKSSRDLRSPPSRSNSLELPRPHSTSPERPRSRESRSHSLERLGSHAPLAPVEDSAGPELSSVDVDVTFGTVPDKPLFSCIVARVARYGRGAVSRDFVHDKRRIEMLRGEDTLRIYAPRRATRVKVIVHASDVRTHLPASDVDVHLCLAWDKRYHFRFEDAASRTMLVQRLWLSGAKDEDRWSDRSGSDTTPGTTTPSHTPRTTPSHTPSHTPVTRARSPDDGVPIP